MPKSEAGIGNYSCGPRSRACGNKAGFAEISRARRITRSLHSGAMPGIEPGISGFPDAQLRI
jgi:hypothetical protein